MIRRPREVKGTEKRLPDTTLNRTVGHSKQMADNRTIEDDKVGDVGIGDGGDWLSETTWLASHAQAVAARLRANGQEAYSIGLAGTPGFLAGRMLVMGAIDPGDFERLFARARAES